MASLDLANQTLDLDHDDQRQNISSNTPKSSPPSLSQDLEKQDSTYNQASAKESIYKSLGWLDRLLALWILLTIIIGIVLGQYVDGVEDALQRGKFVDVSIPIGKSLDDTAIMNSTTQLTLVSHRSACHDVSDFMQSPVRDFTRGFQRAPDMDSDWF